MLSDRYQPGAAGPGRDRQRHGGPCGRPLAVTLAVSLVLAPAMPARALDNSFELLDVRVFEETFLDINANGFRKSLDQEWRWTGSGWRMGGGSTNSDRLYMRTDVRAHTQLSPDFRFGFDLEQDDYFAPQPPQPLLLFADYYPFERADVGVSFLGTAAVDKRQSDLGLALTLGRRPGEHLRLSWLRRDHFYNGKNDIDQSFYERSGETLRLQLAHRPGPDWEIHLDLRDASPLTFVFDDLVSRYRHRAHDHEISLIRHLDAQRFTGLDLRVIGDRRTLSDGEGTRAQELDYQSIDAYWVQGLRQAYELTLGLRYDEVTEGLRGLPAAGDQSLLELRTLQGYGAVYHEYSLHQAWDLGLYAGWSERQRRAPAEPETEVDDAGIQAKLRTSWQYQSADRASRLLVSVSFNLDSLLDNAGDGGGIYYQTRF